MDDSSAENTGVETNPEPARRAPMAMAFKDFMSVKMPKNAPKGHREFDGLLKSGPGGTVALRGRVGGVNAATRVGGSPSPGNPPNRRQENARTDDNDAESRPDFHQLPSNQGIETGG